MKKVILDCDNTMGIKGCDVDDGLAFLYLLGKKDIELYGITTTYGNSDIDTVQDNMQTMLAEIQRTDICSYKGCPDPLTLESQAVDFLVDSVNTFPGEISILATGSLTNLYAAFCKDNTFFDKVDELVVMGGITQELVIHGKVLQELNFSCDWLAAKCVLVNGRRLAVLTGNSCLDAYFTQKEFTERLQMKPGTIAQYVFHKCFYWFEDMRQEFQLDGFYNWDIVAAVYLAEPKLFTNNYRTIDLDTELLKTGYLLDLSGNNNNLQVTINIPTINNSRNFTEEVYSAWFRQGAFPKE